MKIVFDDAQLETLFFQAKSEAKKSFNDDTIYMEKYLAKPRHIEIQIFGDGKGKPYTWGKETVPFNEDIKKFLKPPVQALWQKILKNWGN